MQAYTTPAEWLNYPSDLDTSTLVIGGDAAAQTAELTRLISRAASQIDQQFCYQPLYASQVTETTIVRPDPYSSLRVRCRRFPILSVVSAQWRQSSVQPWVPIPITSITLFGALDLGHHYVADNFPYGGYGGWGLPPLTVQTTYIAGYPNAVLTAAVVAGATTLPMDTTLGFQPGDTATLYDGANTETVTIAAASGTTLTVAAGTLNAHAAGVRCSEVPEAVTLANILLTNWLIKGRRAGGGIMMHGSVQPSGLDSQEYQQARDLVRPFARVV